MDDNLKRKIYQSIGAASMCWDQTPKGIFESDRAKLIGEDLEAAIESELETLCAMLGKIKEHLLIAKEYIDATECTQPCDSRGVCFRCSIEGDILISLKEYS